MFHLKEYQRFSFRDHLKLHKNVKKKHIFKVVIDGLFDSAIEGVIQGAPRDAINNPYKDAQKATVTSECKQKFANILIFQLLLFMFNVLKIQVINRGSAG